MHIKYSIVWNVSKEQLQELVDLSTSMSDVCKRLGLDSQNGSIRSLYRRIKLDNIDTTKLKQNSRHERQRVGFRTKLKLEEIFVENSSVVRSTVRKYVIKLQLINYACDKCDNSGDWLGQPISLQLEHRNGVNNDHRISNLCWLCPNCHSQTSTFCGRNSRTNNKKQKKDRPRKFDPQKEELKDLITKHSFVSIGKMFGVSDNAVRKRCKKYNLI